MSRKFLALLGATAAAGVLSMTAVQAADLPTFEQLDADGNGSISADEAKANPEVEAMFGQIDVNGDGQVTQEEYAAVVQG